MKYSELKSELKKLANEIHETKIALKEYQRKNGGYQGGFLSKCWKLSYEFRHKHIAYCLLRGTDREKIECPADNNLPNDDYIMEIYNAHKKANENVRACA